MGGRGQVRGLEQKLTMLLHHVVGEAEHVRRGGSEGHLPQVDEIPQQIPSYGALHVPEEPYASWVGLGGRLHNLMQQDELVQRQNWEWPAKSRVELGKGWCVGLSHTRSRDYGWPHISGLEIATDLCGLTRLVSTQIPWLRTQKKTLPSW